MCVSLASEPPQEWGGGGRGAIVSCSTRAALCSQELGAGVAAGPCGGVQGKSEIHCGWGGGSRAPSREGEESNVGKDLLALGATRSHALTARNGSCRSTLTQHPVGEQPVSSPLFASRSSSTSRVSSCTLNLNGWLQNSEPRTRPHRAAGGLDPVLLIEKP